jgi:amino acid transporter
VQSLVTALILCSGVVLVGGALAWGDVKHTEPLIVDPATGVLRVLIRVPALLVGFDVLPQSAEEANLPPQRLGWLLVASLLLAVVWYGAISFGVALSIPHAELASAQMATADAASRVWRSEAAGTLLILGGTGGILTSWNAFIIGASRVLFAMAESGSLPTAFARLHPKYQPPYVGSAALGVLACLSPLFGRTILVWLIGAGSFAIVVAYLFVPIAFLALRRQQPEFLRPFRVRAPRLVGGIAILLSLCLLTLYLPGSPSALTWPAEWAMVLGWSLLGLLVWMIWGRRGAA